MTVYDVMILAILGALVVGVALGFLLSFPVRGEARSTAKFYKGLYESTDKSRDFWKGEYERERGLKR